MKNLKYLRLNNNQISKLPKQISYLNSLVKLSLDYNKLIEAPKEIGHIKKLPLHHQETNRNDKRDSNLDYKGGSK